MDKKTKRTFIIVGAVEAAVLIFCLVVAILVYSTFDKNNPSANMKSNPFIGTLQTNPVLLFFVIVFPALLIFLVDGGYLIYYAVKRESSLNEKEKSAIEEEAKRQAREEVLKELKAEQMKTSENKPADPAEKK
jgi:uncharacterized membrane protein